MIFDKQDYNLKGDDGEEHIEILDPDKDEYPDKDI